MYKYESKKNWREEVGEGIKNETGENRAKGNIVSYAQPCGGGRICFVSLHTSDS